MIPKNYNAFVESFTGENPNALWPEALKALWYDGKGDWEKAHSIAQDVPTVLGNWIHAYLHRKEGDEWNAGYWYQRAYREYPAVGLNKEFEELVKAVIKSKRV
ncbi:hypothetical protein [Lentiprolixibacter aurantiacus]|uniref:Tetratricopeptide repeat protein n=1 Tax=Lentiprolixibacter aurantiacus TaxID=2993939 RepID=A0AAE3SNN5_9FLAO|nr:hypothetical protein [Lentiprolixibacter aurantiacus]MCX2719371.1 hypothetical protein [Lentiprolixibacter aurantiacus]